MITIPETDLLVHQLCLGGNVFGWSADQSQSHQVLGAYCAGGGNFIDTADVYSEWKDGNIGGESETIIGTWMQKNNNRTEMVIATKVAKLTTRAGLSPSNIMAACDDSLRRLQTDYIDLYYSHDDDPNTPIEETLGAYDKLITAGKIRYIGASNFTPERLQQSLNISESHQLPTYVAVQDHYNLIHRKSVEGALSKVLDHHGMSVLPYFGLARGFLTGKYRPGLEVDSMRAQGVKEYANPKNWAIIEALDLISKNHNCSISAVALGWLRANPLVSTPLASATTTEQVSEIMQIISLTSEEVAELNALSA